MKKFFCRLAENRLWALVLGVLGVAALFLLSTGLQSLELQPAVHYLNSGEREQNPQILDHKMVTLSIAEQVILIILFLFVLGVVLLLLTPEGRKRLLASLIRLGLALLVVMMLVNKVQQPEGTAGEPAAAGPGMQVEGAQEGVEAIYTPPSTPPWVVFLTSLAVILFFLAVGYWLWSRSRPRPESLPRQLARIARSALEEFRAGGQLDDIVVECYTRMSAAVTAQRGLERPIAMTPSEFAERLERAGLPADPVRRLTRLFEKVRYGGVRSSQEEANEAITCLTAILQYCGEQA